MGHPGSGIIKMFNINYSSDSILFKPVSFISGIYTYLKTCLNTSTHSYLPARDIVVTQFCFYLSTYLVFCYLISLLRLLLRNRLTKSKYFDSYAERILLVIAHPDDECRFFGPLILRMMHRHKSLFLLCLSNGEADAARSQRKREFWSSCRVLGVKSEHIFLCNSSLRLEVGMPWRIDNIASLIQDHVEILDIDTLVTFDKLGITGDTNHISVFKAVSYLNLRTQLPINCHIFLLDSLGWVRHYSSVMDVALSVFSSENVFILTPNDHYKVFQAMKAHKTRLHWYQRLYLRFSRYLHVNSLSELPRYVHPIRTR